ncbi:MAG: class I adenylate-forming enzyme family protein [Actinomycetes bacterium]
MAGALLNSLAELPAPHLVDGERRLDASEVERLADTQAHDMQEGDWCPFVATSTAESVLTFLACWRSGAVAAPLHARLTPQEQDEIRARVLALPRERGLGVVLATSGSSGRPKIVRHTSPALAYKAQLMVDVHGLTSDDVVLMPAPLAHVSGLLNGVLLPGAARMTTVLMQRWSATDALNLIEREGVTFMIGPPTYFVQMMADPSFSGDRVASVRLISCGGAGVDALFARRAADAFGAVVKRTYGSTEAPTVTTSYAGDAAELGWATDGRPVGDVELRIDSETGELSVRGSELFIGYDDREATNAVLSADGWFRTGDRATVTDGWLTVLGRIGETIIRGGENVDPHEVEQVCAGLPDVGQVVVVGYPDEEMGERVGLVVVGREPTLAELREHCAENGLARYKTPERILGVREIPVLTVGKPDRATLREWLGSQRSST